MTDNITADSIPSDKKVIDWTHIKLTPLEEPYIDLLYVWQNIPSIRDLTLGFRFPFPRSREAAACADPPTPMNSFRLARSRMSATLASALVVTLGLRPRSRSNTRLASRRFVGESK